MTTTEIPNLAFKSAAAAATIRFGSATVNGRLISAHAEDPMPKTESRSPDGGIVKQCYVDDDGNLHGRNDLKKVVKISKDKFRDVDPEDLKEAKASELVPNAINLTAYNPKDVEGKFISDGKLYVFDTQLAKKGGTPIPLEPMNEQWCDFIYAIVEKGDVVLMGMGLVGRNSEAPFRLVIHQGNLALEKLAFPVELREFQPRSVELSRDDKRKAIQTAKSVVKDFDPDTFRYTELDNMIKIRDGKFKSNRKKAAPQATKQDLSAALEGFEA